MASVTRTKLRNAIAEALWDYVSATQLSDVCDDLRMPPAPADVHPMSSKRQYVHSRTKTYEMTQLVATAREVVLDYPHEDLVALLAELDGTSGGVRGELKNIIFAAVGAKPKIVLRDALNNDVDIVEGAERCLVYDAPLGEEGLSWRSLVHWSAQRDGVMVTDANERELAVALFNRLARSVGSEPELLMLRTYAAFYREHGFDLPALMPQVYLHYDPYSAAQIGGKPRLFRQRMDFLMLLPRRVRVVVEIDGKQHYSNEDGTANPARYAVMVREDRQLRLVGYEIYRFGGYEFIEDQDPATMLRAFYSQLLTRHGVIAQPD